MVKIAIRKNEDSILFIFYVKVKAFKYVSNLECVYKIQFLSLTLVAICIIPISIAIANLEDDNTGIGPVGQVNELEAAHNTITNIMLDTQNQKPYPFVLSAITNDNVLVMMHPSALLPLQPDDYDGTIPLQFHDPVVVANDLGHPTVPLEITYGVIELESPYYSESDRILHTYQLLCEPKPVKGLEDICDTKPLPLVSSPLPSNVVPTNSIDNPNISLQPTDKVFDPISVSNIKLMYVNKDTLVAIWDPPHHLTNVNGLNYERILPTSYNVILFENNDKIDRQTVTTPFTTFTPLQFDNKEKYKVRITAIYEHNDDVVKKNAKSNIVTFKPGSTPSDIIISQLMPTQTTDRLFTTANVTFADVNRYDINDIDCTPPLNKIPLGQNITIWCMVVDKFGKTDIITFNVSNIYERVSDSDLKIWCDINKYYRTCDDFKLNTTSTAYDQFLGRDKISTFPIQGGEPVNIFGLNTTNYFNNTFFTNSTFNNENVGTLTIGATDKNGNSGFVTSGHVVDFLYYTDGFYLQGFRNSILPFGYMDYNPEIHSTNASLQMLYADAAFIKLNKLLLPIYKNDTLTFNGTTVKIENRTGIQHLPFGTQIKIGGTYNDDIGFLQSKNATAQIGSRLMLEQGLANYMSQRGDSGAPLFINDDTLVGLHVGKGCIIHAIHGIEQPVNSTFRTACGTFNKTTGFFEHTASFKVFSPWDAVESMLELK